MTLFLFRSNRRDGTWLKKFTNASNYGKFIYIVFGWDTVKTAAI